MARQPNEFTTFDPNENINQEAIQEASDARDLISRAVTDDQVQLSEMVGMVRAFDFTQKFLTVGYLKMLASFKESKKYKGLQVTDRAGNIRRVDTFAELCAAIGLSDKKVYEDLQNLQLLGEDFLETSQSIGLGYRQLRALRKLPEDDRQLVINNEVVKAGDRESLIDLIEELVERNAKEKEQLTKERDDALVKRKQEAEVSERIISIKDEKINALDKELYRRSRMPAWPEIVQETNLATTIAAGSILEMCDRLEILRETILNQDLQGSSASEAMPYLDAMANHYCDALDQAWGRLGELMNEADGAFQHYRDAAQARELNAPQPE